MQQGTPGHARDFSKRLLKAHLSRPHNHRIGLHAEGVKSFEAVFLGTHGINADLFSKLIQKAIDGNVKFRNRYFPGDPDYVDESIRHSTEFIESSQLLECEFEALVEQLQHSGTFFSMRSIGHMLWDTTMPGVLGYFAALLYNQNNVAAEASPMTTLMEIEAGNDLCKMLGYSIQPSGQALLSQESDVTTGWGHITCDGSIANLEALWMARNLKFYPVSVRSALRANPAFEKLKSFCVTKLNNESHPLIGLNDWDVLNLPIDEVLNIAERMYNEYHESTGITREAISDAISGYSIQNIGMHEMLKQHLPDIAESPVSICSSTRHYSWPKGAAILGIGANHMLSLKIDLNARMDTRDLIHTLKNCLMNRIPVMSVIAIIGTTEESSVDPLVEILRIRDEFRLKGMEFAVHCDAAWGGYFRSMLNSPEQNLVSSYGMLGQAAKASLPMSRYVTAQYEVMHLADSITIDPHKSGYIPYPAGGLCYRNSAMRNLVSFTAPVVYHGGVDPTVGVYGVEGSKPGAAAAAVYFSHKVIRPDMSGYGKISGDCFFNAKRFYAALVCINLLDLPFFVVPLIPLPAEKKGLPYQEVRKQCIFIRDRIVNKTNEELLNDLEAFELFKELGGDQTIITYLFNFKTLDGAPNPDLTLANQLNDEIYRKFSFKPFQTNPEDTPLIVTSSAFTRAMNGDLLVDALRARMGVNTGKDGSINFLISTIMNPWLSNTVRGDFIPSIMEIIIHNIASLVKQINAQKENTITVQNLPQ